MLSVAVNWWAVLVAAGVNMIVGFSWYTPAIFGKTWAKLIGIKMDQMGGPNPPRTFALTGLAALLQGYILAHFVAYVGATDGLSGATTGVWLWMGFVLTTAGVNTMFAGRPLKLFLIDSGYYLVVFAINGALLAAWR